MERQVDLADAIESLRAELTSAIERGRATRMRFVLAPIELTLQVAVVKEADGTVGWKVLELGGRFESSITQTIGLTLTPRWIGDDGTWTAEPMISDIATPDER